jgi:pyridoxal phosphate enzyme (YggS family)
MADSLTERLATVEARIADACRRSGRTRADVVLVGVTKGVDAGTVRAAAAAGLVTYGENYVQEWLGKRAVLADLALTWHFIGRIQRNKAVKVAEAALVHSLADARVGAALAAAGVRGNRPVRALVQVNLAGETTKDGVDPRALPKLLAELRGLSGLDVEGLMAIPPPLALDEARRCFRALRELRDRQEDPARLRELSMGMSADFDVAIEEGATIVRIGTAIFGPRKGKP